MNSLRVLVADDHAVLREGLAMLIDAQPDMGVVAQARGGREATQLAQRFHPDVVVLDISMPDLDGAEAAEQIRADCPGAHVLALTRHADQGYLRRLLRAGATGYVLKKTAGDALIDAIRTVSQGGTYIDASLVGGLVSRALSASETSDEPMRRRAELTEREEQVLRLIAWGQSNKEVAAKLGISVKTVESYKATALDKLRLRSRTDILRYALAQKWLSEDADPE
jgi:DNA-binding NarL/FixJ family response regulator